MSRKAITPLISSILLIVFAVALGFLVMSWGRAESTLPAECGLASISLVSLEEKKQVCYQGNELLILVENDGQTAISGLTASIIGEKGTGKESFVKKMEVADISQVAFTYADIGRLQKVKVMPQLDGKVCPKNGFSVENIEECKNV